MEEDRAQSMDGAGSLGTAGTLMPASRMATIPQEILKLCFEELITLEAPPPPTSANLDKYVRDGITNSIGYLEEHSWGARRPLWEPLEHLGDELYAERTALHVERQRARRDMFRFERVCKRWHNVAKQYRDQILVIGGSRESEAQLRRPRLESVQNLHLSAGPGGTSTVVCQVVELLVCQMAMLTSLLVDTSAIGYLEPILRVLPRQHQQIRNLAVLTAIGNDTSKALSATSDRDRFCDTLRACSQLHALSLGGDQLCCDWTEVLHATSALEFLKRLDLANLVNPSTRMEEPLCLQSESLEFVRVVDNDGMTLEAAAGIWDNSAASLRFLQLNCQAGAPGLLSDCAARRINTAYPSLQYLSIECEEGSSSWIDNAILANLIENSPSLEFISLAEVECAPNSLSTMPSPVDRLRAKVGNGVVRFLHYRQWEGEHQQELVDLIESPPPEWRAAGVKAYWSTTVPEEEEV